MIKTKTIYYIYKIHFLCGFPTGRYYIGRHTHHGTLDTDKYAGSGNFCKAYFKKYGKQEGITYLKEILEINPSYAINKTREDYYIGDKYKSDPLCMNLVAGGEGEKPNDYSKKGVIQYDLNGNKLYEYDSQLEAASALGLSSSCGISACCLRKTKSAAGYYWTFSDETLPENLKTHHVPNHRRVIQYNKDGIQVAKFNSAMDASQRTNIHIESIYMSCNKRRYSGGKYIWRWEDDPLSLSELHNHKYWGKVPILQYDLDGNYIQTFDSLRTAAKAVGASWQSIQRVCMGKRKTTHGYKWKYGKEN